MIGTMPIMLIAICIVQLFLAETVEAASKTRLTWINGIGYNLDHMNEGSKEISLFFGGEKVVWCHNPTMMASENDMRGYLSDLTQAGAQKLGRITAEVETLVKHLKNAVSEVGKHGRVVHIAHSQGALITSLAAKQLSPLEMNQIEVISFGGAAALRRTPETPFKRCINYYSVNDPLLWVVPAAEQALRSGYVADEEFCFLAPRIGDPIADHHLSGPTYMQALKWEGQRFQRKYHSAVYRSTKFLLLFLVEFCKHLRNIIRKIVLSIAQCVLAVCVYLNRCSDGKLASVFVPIRDVAALVISKLLIALRVALVAFLQASKERKLSEKVRSLLKSPRK